MIAASAVRSIITDRFGRKTFMQEIYIKSFMTTLVKSVPPFTPLSDVIETMKDSPHSCLIITENEIPVGIITERDIVRLVGGLVSDCLSLGQPVREVMSQPVVTIDANTSLLDALVIAKSKHVRHLPVDNAEGKLVGLVTQSDLVTAQFRNHEMQARILERELADCMRESAQLRRSVAELSREEPLLKIGNLRAMEDDLRHMNAISSRYHRPYSVALFGVDHFSSFNERYGRSSADAALQIISSHFREGVRAADRLYRCRSEEFLILLPETFSDGARVLAQRLMKEIVACGLPHEEHPMKVLTISAGVSSRDQWVTDVSWQGIVERAGEALQEARRIGPNHVITSETKKTSVFNTVPFHDIAPRQ
jgi:diguanylate cyclase (GGDEF)-like protein